MRARSPSNARFRFLVAGCFAFALLAITAGCGPDYKARAVVKGKVKTGKTNLTYGTVTFYGPNNITTSAFIDENGNYEMKDAPIGDVRIAVAVNTPMGMSGGAGQGPMTGPGGMGPGKGPGMPGVGPGAGGKGESDAWKKAAAKVPESKDPEGNNPGIAIMSKVPANLVRIDPKYASPDTSGLTYKVEKGEHTHDIDL